MQIPPTADLIAPQEGLAYLDVQAMTLPYPLLALNAWDKALTRPLPLLRVAFALRDTISVCFGVRRIGGFSGRRKSDLTQGDMLDFFLIERLAPEVLTLTALDRHLDVMTCVTTSDQTLIITSSVKTDLWFGKACMLPVRVAQRYIVRAMFSQFPDRDHPAL